MVKWFVLVILGIIGIILSPNLRQGELIPWLVVAFLIVVLLSFFPYWLRKKFTSNDNKLPSISIKYFLIQYVLACLVLVPALIRIGTFCFDEGFAPCQGPDIGFYLEIVIKVILTTVGVGILSQIAVKVLFFIRNQLIASFVVGLLNFGAWVLLMVWWF